MFNNENIVYRLNDDISFRTCTVLETGSEYEVGNCTNFQLMEGVSQPFYICRQHGIHFQCTKHPNVELELINRFPNEYVKCNKCNKDCIKLLNTIKLKDVQLIRLDDWYVPEYKKKINLKGESDYWVTVDVKMDRDKDTMIVLYVGKKNSPEKSQFFIKPEKLQLSSDYKDLDPSTVLSKIEVTLRDRKITQEYDEKDV